MKRILFSLLFAASFLQAIAQPVEAIPTLVGKATVSQTGSGAGYWQVAGNFTDESGYYSSSDLQVGDILFFTDAGIGYHLPITVIVSATPPSFEVRVNNTGITGVLAVPTGPGSFYRPSSVGLGPYTSGITDANQQTLNNYIIAKTSAAISSGGGSGVDTVSNYVALRAYTGPSLMVFVQDFAQTTGGVFRRVPSGSENGGTLIAAANGVKWKRVFDDRTFYPEYWQVGGFDERGVAGGITDVTEKIQAAINMATAVAGDVVLRKAFSPYDVIPKVPNITVGGFGCVDLKNNIRLVIGQGVVLRKANGAQTDATGGVSVVYGDTLSNVWIGGGGRIEGNTAGQTGWTLGYSQAGVYGSGIFIAQSNSNLGRTNSNISIEGLSITDLFSTACELIGIELLSINNLYWSATGEGLEIQRSSSVTANAISALGTGVEVGDGFETAGCSNIFVSNLFISNWGAGTAIDLYATKTATVTNFSIIGTRAQGGISAGAAGTEISENILFSNGYIKGLANGALIEDGDIKYSSIVFDSCAIGVQVTNGSNPLIAVKQEGSVDGCVFRNSPGGTGILFNTNKRCFVTSCVFNELSSGIAIVASATRLTPRAYISSCVFKKTTSSAIVFDAQGEALFAPEVMVSGCSFDEISGAAVSLAGNTSRVRVDEILIDSVFVFSTAIGSRIMYVTASSANTITSMPAGTDGQEVTFVTNMPGGNTKTFREGGNLLLQGKEDFVMVQSCQIVFKYVLALAKWVEVSRTQAGDISNSTTATLDRKYFIPDWSIDNVGAANQTNVVIARMNSLNFYGRDFYFPLTGMVRKFGIISNEAITTGSITANLMFSGTGPNGTVTLSGGQTSNTTLYGRYGKTFGALTFLGVTFTTSATFNHPNADILVWMEVEF